MNKQMKEQDGHKQPEGLNTGNADCLLTFTVLILKLYCLSYLSFPMPNFQALDSVCSTW